MRSLPPQVREALEVVLTDLQQPTPVDLRFDYEVPPDGPPIFPESEGPWGEARPACPGHGHPARPEELSGQAWWTCPADGRRIAPIGSLAA